MPTPRFVSSRPKRSLALALPVILAVLVILSFAWPTAAASQGEGQPLVFAGCGSNGPITRLLTQAFSEARPGTRFDVRPVGSTNGIWLAAAGAVPVGLISRPLTDAERTLGLVAMPYARTALVIAAHPSVRDDNITTEELVATYKGARARWRNGQQIVLLSREPGDSAVSMLARQVPGFQTAYLDSQRAGRAVLAYSEQAMVRALASRPNALGFTDLGTLTIERLSMNALRVNGVQPTLDTLENGRYPFVKTLAFVYRPDKVPPALKSFMDFVRSAPGERLLRANGYLPA
jgi:phosphate transport system substrate-binding protein